MGKQDMLMEFICPKCGNETQIMVNEKQYKTIMGLECPKCKSTMKPVKSAFDRGLEIANGGDKHGY